MANSPRVEKPCVACGKIYYGYAFSKYCLDCKVDRMQELALQGEQRRRLKSKNKKGGD